MQSPSSTPGIAVGEHRFFFYVAMVGAQDVYDTGLGLADHYLYYRYDVRYGTK